MASNKSVEKMGTENVVNCLYRHPGAAFKLICFPWAGSGSSHFAKWAKSFHHSIEVSSIRLPGRESRSNEPVATNLGHVAAEISNALLPILQDIPFAILVTGPVLFPLYQTACSSGHLEALHLKENYKLQPMHFFVSSANPPHVSNEICLDAPYHSGMSEEQVFNIIMTMGGIPKDILENKELLEMFLPILKADIHMMFNFTYVKTSKTLLSCDITCFSGTEDTAKKTEGWKDLTSGSVENHKFPGNRFYLTNPSNETFIINYITKCLEMSCFA
uniref:S-acyl fatty acid synthase thioesterase, medium chain n=1 Tax=Phascolarctos cinereus TaxID=38626 RepID=A0A6P5KBK4_PHACI|nr:S-acyl fatty acid synthase thioesterase, medium chain [Phascolarctos cinereus]